MSGAGVAGGRANRLTAETLLRVLRRIGYISLVLVSVFLLTFCAFTLLHLFSLPAGMAGYMFCCCFLFISPSTGPIFAKLSALVELWL